MNTLSSNQNALLGSDNLRTTQKILRHFEHHGTDSGPSLILKAREVGADHLRGLLSRKYGNLVRAWRRLDENGNGKIDRAEFAEICRGFQIDRPLNL